MTNLVSHLSTILVSHLVHCGLTFGDQFGLTLGEHFGLTSCNQFVLTFGEISLSCFFLSDGCMALCPHSPGGRPSVSTN